MSKNLILLATAFPYGSSETYLETEVKYYGPFDSVRIFSLNILKNQRNKIRELPSEKFKVFPVFRALGYVYLLYAVVALTDRNLYSEIGRLLHQNRFSVRRLAKLFIYLSRAHRDADIILRYLRKSGENLSEDNSVIYSYRFEYQAYVALLLKRKMPKCVTVARGHRYDLYEEENSVKYIPMREFLMQHLDRVVMISDDGRDYLTRKYPEYTDKVIVSRLGTATYPEKITSRPDGVLNIVSCSNVVPVKRLDLIVKSLMLIKETPIHWTHYGDGELLDTVKKLCDDLGANITCDFRGNIENSQIMDDYSRKDYHLFLNVSSSEGIPVSIMEAMSFGIPCIATNVGGTKEIIENGVNGVLLDPAFSPDQLANQINDFVQMSEEDYQRFRRNARSSWKEKFCADKNYSEFINLIRGMV